VIENLIACAPEGTAAYYYRTSSGAEIDLLLLLPDGKRWAVEIKRSLVPRPDRGFYDACKDLKPLRSFVVYPGTERFPLGEDIEAIGLAELAHQLHRYPGTVS
jgi:predicted AAA+ superfamily ATPase